MTVTRLWTLCYYLSDKKERKKEILHVLTTHLHFELKNIKITYLLTIISSPTPVARHSEPATLVAIFSRGRVTIGRPAHRTSVPVVCALHNGLHRTKPKYHCHQLKLIDLIVH